MESDNLCKYFIKIYIVTYNNNYVLNNWILKSLFESDIYKYNYEVNVINNHSNISINQDYQHRVNLLNNVLRPDWSSMHLSRNWNQAILNGFIDLKNPDCDILVCIQNDEILQKGWINHLIEYHKDYTFIQFGVGDSFLSFKPEAISEIGLFDERFFCGYQENDYFLRAILYNRDKTSLNCFSPINNFKSFILNPVDNKILVETYCGNDDRREKEAIESWNTYKNYQFYSNNLFKLKWGKNDVDDFVKDINSIPKKSLIQNYIFYPYFEKDVYNLKEMNYVVP